MKPLGRHRHDHLVDKWRHVVLPAHRREEAHPAVRERVEAIRQTEEADGAEFNKTDERIAKEESQRASQPRMPAATSLTRRLYRPGARMLSPWSVQVRPSG